MTKGGSRRTPRPKNGVEAPLRVAEVEPAVPLPDTPKDPPTLDTLHMYKRKQVVKFLVENGYTKVVVALADEDRTKLEFSFVKAAVMLRTGRSPVHGPNHGLLSPSPENGPTVLN